MPHDRATTVAHDRDSIRRNGEDELPSVGGELPGSMWLPGGCAEKEMLQRHCVVQHRDARALDGQPVVRAVDLFVADVIKMNVGPRGARPDIAPLLERSQQRRRVIRHPGPGGRQRRMESDRHAFFLRLPNSAVPTRTEVAPSSIATSISFDMPMESSRRPCCPAISRRRAK